MPYIPQERRALLLSDITPPTNAGELNFLVSMTVDRYLCERGVSYASLNDVIGVLECAKQEVYRRLAAPYEDRKIVQNGDVFSHLISKIK